MTNLEYLVSKNKLDFYDLCFLAHLSKYNRNCSGKSCTECEFKREFNGNIQYCLEVLLAEHKETVKITKNEKAILESIDKEYKWIARDSDGNLGVYTDKPSKNFYGWGNHDYYKYFELFNHLFQFIKFEDKEPYNIQELLANCEVEER